MISMDVNHPDIEEFINVKTNLTKVTKANISVMVDNKFMKKVTGEDPNPMYKTKFVVDTVEHEVIEKEINAKELFNILCINNYDYAEPGILFWDRIKDYNILSNDKEFEYAGVNPCFTGDMKLLTENGFKTFKELCNTRPYIYNYEGKLVQSKVWCSGKKNTIKLTLSNGSIIKCTPNHKFMTVEGEECSAKDLKNRKLMNKTIKVIGNMTFAMDTDIQPFVTKIENNGEQLVYDFKEPLTHWGIVEGFVVHNCAGFSAQSKN